MDFSVMSLVEFNTIYYLLFSCVLSFCSFPILFLCFFSNFPFHLWTLDPIWTMISTLTSLWPLRWPTFISDKISGNCVPSASATHRLASAFIHDSEASTQIGGTFDIQEFATQHGFAPLFWVANRRIPQTRLSRSTSGAWLNRLGPGSRKGPPYWCCSCWALLILPAIYYSL